MSERDRDRPKKTWRELDSARERAQGSRSGQDPDRSRSSSAEARASKQHRAALDALFAKGEIGKLADKLAAPATRESRPRAAPASEPGPATPPAPGPTEDPRAVLRKKLLEAGDREAISRAFDRYVKAHGLPIEFELLEQGLEHQRDDRVAEILAALEARLERERPRRSRSLSGKLRFLEETSDDQELRQAAARVRAKLG